MEGDDKEYSCVDEVFQADIVEEVADDIMYDSGFGSAIDLLDDTSDGDLIDLVMKGEL